jgi:SulP family sulfate permease
VIIFFSQIKDFLGLRMGSVPAEFFQKWIQFSQHFNSINPAAVLISVGTILLILGWGKINKQIPGPLVALIVFTLLAHFLGLHVETIGSRFGEIPHNFPKPVFPSVTLEILIPLIPSIFAITLLGGIESLLSAVVADGMIKGQHRPNMEFVAQGFANITSPIFGGIPVTGAIARTATNVHSGGRTPVAGIVHSIILLLIMLFLGQWVKYIPLSCLAGILVLICYKMGDWKNFARMLKDSRTSMVITLSTFLITVVVDLVVGIIVGTILAVLLKGFIRKIWNN